MTTEQQLNRIVELLEQILTAQGQQPLPRPEPVTPAPYLEALAIARSGDRAGAIAAANAVSKRLMAQEQTKGAKKMKTLATIAIGIICLGVSLLCLGHMGQLVPVLPRAWFLLFVGASACASYAFLGVSLIWYAVQESRAKKTRENKHREQRRYATTTTGLPQ